MSASGTQLFSQKECAQLQNKQCIVYKMYINIGPVVQCRALPGGWKEKKLSGNDKLSGFGDTSVNNCTVFIFNYLILFS